MQCRWYRHIFRLLSEYMSKLADNPNSLPDPFRLVLPDSADPALIVDLFETVETFDSLRSKGNHVVIGPRGSGKSMILRRLSASVKLQASGYPNPEFFGVYVLLRSNHAELFRRSFRDTADPRPFQHFLACYVIAQILHELHQQPFGSAVAEPVRSILDKNCRFLNGHAAQGLLATKSVFDNQWEEAIRIADGLTRSSLDFLPTNRVPDIVSAIAEVLRRSADCKSGIALLIDSYGYLRELAGYINDWMRKDTIDSLTVKAGGVVSDEALKSTLVDFQPEPEFDYNIIPHQFDTVSGECQRIFRQIANKRLAREKLSVAVEELLPSDFENTKLKWVGAKPTAFEYLCALTGGDVTAFLAVLEKLWRGIKLNNCRCPASAEAFGTSCRKLSGTYWKETIPVQARDEWRELQSLTRSAAKRASEHSKEAMDPASVVIGFEIQDSTDSDRGVKRVLQTALRLGILQCDPDDRAALDIDSDFCPKRFELNRRLCAYSDFGLDPRGTAHSHVNFVELKGWMETAYHGQDDKVTGGGSGLRSHFSWSKCVFVSCPLPTTTSKRPEHQKRLLQGLFDVLSGTEDGQIRLARKPEKEDVVRDPLDLKVEDFVREIPDAIRNCRFVVHDVTSLSPGVAFEIGLGIGFRKVRSLVWDEARGQFKPDELPLLVATRFNVNHFPFKSDPGFKSWLDSNVVRPCLQKVGETLVPSVPKATEHMFHIYWKLI